MFVQLDIFIGVFTIYTLAGRDYLLSRSSREKRKAKPNESYPVKVERYPFSA